MAARREIGEGLADLAWSDFDLELDDGDDQCPACGFIGYGLSLAVFGGCLAWQPIPSEHKGFTYDAHGSLVSHLRGSEGRRLVRGSCSWGLGWVPESLRPRREREARVAFGLEARSLSAVGIADAGLSEEIGGGLAGAGRGFRSAERFFRWARWAS